MIFFDTTSTYFEVETDDEAGGEDERATGAGDGSGAAR